MTRFYQKIADPSCIHPNIVYLITAHHPPCQLGRTWKFTLAGHALYICTRCLGQYVGIAVGILLLRADQAIFESVLATFLFFAIAPLPAVLDWTCQTLTRWESKNWIRFATGFAFGLALGATLKFAVTLNWSLFWKANIVFMIYLGGVLWFLRKPGVLVEYLRPYEEFLSMDDFYQRGE